MPDMSTGQGQERGRESGPYVELDRETWAELGKSRSRWGEPLSAEEIDRVRGLGDELDLDEVQQV